MGDRPLRDQKRIHFLYATRIWEPPRIAAAPPTSPPTSIHKTETLPCLRIGVTAVSYHAYRKMRSMSNRATRIGNFRPRMVLIGAALVIGAVGTASAAGIAQIVHARVSHFKTLGRTAKSLRDQIWRSHPNWNVVADDARQIERLAAALPSWFPAGSGKGHGIRTRTSAAIWSQPQLFARAAQRLLNRAKDVDQAAASRNLQTLRMRTRALGQACASCHRRFRAHSSWW